MNSKSKSFHRFIVFFCLLAAILNGADCASAGEVLEFEKGRRTLSVSLTDKAEKKLVKGDAVTVILKRDSRKLKGRIVVMQKNDDDLVAVIAADQSVRAFKPESQVQIRKFNESLDQILVHGGSGVVRGERKFGLALKAISGGLREELVGATAFVNLNEMFQFGISHYERRFTEDRKTISDIYIRLFPFNVFHVTAIGAYRAIDGGVYTGREFDSDSIPAVKESLMAGMSFGNQWSFSPGFFVGIDWLTGMRAYQSRVRTAEAELSEQEQKNLESYKKRDRIEVHTGTLMIGAMF